MNDTDTCDRPKWLLELENRKKTLESLKTFESFKVIPRLAHEAGAGAPCVACKEACPGLDLHFWRKICKNCKCSKDDHDVDDEDFPQFDLLFGTSRKYKKKAIFLHINDGREHAQEAFEWIPPNTTNELATDYMKALPVEKLPIKGTTGAALRRQLLQKQLPLHDIDYKTCDELSDQERKQFEKYLENIKKYAGQGTVTKILSARPYDVSLVTPANATDMQQFSPQNKPNMQSGPIHLRTPSSFTPKCSYQTSLGDKAKVPEFCASLEAASSCSNINNTPIVEKYNVVNNNGDIVKSEQVARGLYNKGVGPKVPSAIGISLNIIKEIPQTESVNATKNTTVMNSEATSSWTPAESYREAYKDVLNNPSTDLLHSASIIDNIQEAEAILAEALLPPSTVHVSDIIGSTLDKKGLRFIREKLTNKYSNQESIYLQRNAPNFAKTFDAPNLYHRNNKETDATTGTVTRRNQSAMLLPPQDTIQRVEGSTDNSELTKAEKEVMKIDRNIVHSDPMDSTQVMNTNKLREHIPAIPLAVAENSHSFPASTSQIHLQSPNVNNQQAKLNSFATPSSILHSEKLQTQIFPCETNVAIGQSKNNLSSAENLKGAMEELTIGTVKPQNCHKCEEAIRVGDVAVITEKAKNAVWHPGCFTCDTCNELLVDLVYFYYKNKLYCGRDLAALLGIPRCFACDELIFVREYTVAEGHNYHVKHFCCWDCDIPLAGKQYITENDRPLCLVCYQKTYAKTCNTCEKVIAADQQGVAVKDLNFHAAGNCFGCYICHKNLLNGRFAVKERKIFCSKECISKFLNP